MMDTEDTDRVPFLHFSSVIDRRVEMIEHAVGGKRPVTASGLPYAS